MKRISGGMDWGGAEEGAIYSLYHHALDDNLRADGEVVGDKKKHRSIR